MLLGEHWDRLVGNEKTLDLLHCGQGRADLVAVLTGRDLFEELETLVEEGSELIVRTERVDKGGQRHWSIGPHREQLLANPNKIVIENCFRGDRTLEVFDTLKELRGQGFALELEEYYVALKQRDPSGNIGEQVYGQVA